MIQPDDFLLELPFPPEGESDLLAEVSLHLAWVGLDDPGQPGLNVHKAHSQ